MKIATTILFGTLLISCDAPSSTRTPSLSEINKSEVFDMGFKELLKQKGYSMDIDSSNPMESLQTGNNYSNHYYNLAIDFPDSWGHDRGVAEYSIFRTMQRDSGLVLNLLVIPLNKKYKSTFDKISLSFQESPIAFLNQENGGDYYAYLKRELSTQLGVVPFDLSLSETAFGSFKYLLTSYRFKQRAGDMEYVMRAETLTTQKWNHTYQIAYFAPDIYFNPQILIEAIQTFRLNNPAVLNK